MPKPDTLSFTLDTPEKSNQFMVALRSLDPVIPRLLYGFCSYTNSIIFLDQNYTYITDIHENDGNWRDEYFSPIMKHFGIETQSIDFDELLEEESEALENCVVDISTIKYKEIFAKKYPSKGDKLVEKIKKKIKK